jgi:hypothetical protein
MSIAIVGPAEVSNAQLRTARLQSLPPKLQFICAIVCVLLGAGCARNPAQCEFNAAVDEVKAPPVRATERASRSTEQHDAKSRIRRLDAALLAPQPPPDCEFKRSDVTPVDAEAWARLKSDYERQCYQNAETTARNRLRLLQASSNQEIQTRGARQHSVPPK